MDRLESMSIFVATVETGSLSAAGRKLGIPLPTVSRKLSELETHLSTRLLNRSTRKLALTDAGSAYLAACRRILEDVGEAERAAAGEYRAPTGELVVSAPVVLGRVHVLPIVAEFLDAYPQVDVRLMLVDRLVDLLEEHVDLAVRVGELPDSNLVASRVGELRTVVCASPGYLGKRGTPRSPWELAVHDCITFSALTSADTWSFGSGRDEITVPIRSRLAVTTAEAAVDAAVASIGLTRVLSYQVQAATERGALKIVLEEFEPPPIPINVVRAGQHPLPLKLRAFLDFAAPRLRTQLRAGA